jgi:energy-converting hydrogenase Eha subunit A
LFLLLLVVVVLVVVVVAVAAAAVVVVVVAAVLHLYTICRPQFVEHSSQFRTDMMSVTLLLKSNMPHIICGKL